MTDSYRANLFGEVMANEDFRRVLATTRHTQLVVMTIPPGGEIGSEVHDEIDQVLIAIEGRGTSVLDGVEASFIAGDVVVVPECTPHNIVNTGSTPLRLATIYGPPVHRSDTVHRTREDAERDVRDVPAPQA